MKAGGGGYEDREACRRVGQVMRPPLLGGHGSALQLEVVGQGVVV